ncbi:IS5 family transposase [Streptomyces sp. NPDC014773]|uniref:IS5 family transposase n=1 Tax=Streptomyces sp. NPDC014773 TaxID=3364908 RepID=UPI0036FCA67E
MALARWWVSRRSGQEFGMVRRHELADAQWERMAPLLPEAGGPGGRWADHRTVINGVLYRTRTGIPWRDLPERYGTWQTVYERHHHWSADGTWSRIQRALQAGADAGAKDADGAWAVNVDSTACRAHQHAAGARHWPPKDHPEKGKGGGARGDEDGRDAWGVPGAGWPARSICRPATVVGLWSGCLARAGRGQPDVHPAHVGPECGPHRAWQAPDASGPGLRRQGVLQPRQPRLPA